MSKLKEKLMLSEKGYSDLKKAITACTITNIALLLPSMVACLLFWELLKPFTGETISWAALWKLLGLGLVAAIVVSWPRKTIIGKPILHPIRRPAQPDFGLQNIFASSP